MRNSRGFGMLPGTALLAAIAAAWTLCSDPAGRTLSWFVPLLVLVWIVVRWPFVRVEVTVTNVVRHGWFANRRIRRADIVTVSTEPEYLFSRVPFAGDTNVRLTLRSGRSVALAELVGRPATANRLADQLRDELGLSVGERRRLHH